MTMTRLPRAAQANILTALRDAETVFHIRDGKIAPGLATKAQVAALDKAGWVEERGGVLVLTWSGQSVLADVEALAIYREQSRDHGGPHSAQVSKRPRGRNAIGGGSAPAGRNVNCSDCYKAAVAKREAGETRVRADPVVWFTNESGAAAQREAEIAAGKHILRHLSGDLAAA